MPEFLTRVRVLLVFAGLIGLALITMLSDRNESADGGSWWSRTALEIAIPLQRVVSVPVDMLREIWDRYDPKLDFFPWACGVAHNHTRNPLRKQQTQQVALRDWLRGYLARGGDISHIVEALPEKRPSAKHTDKESA